MTVIFPIRLSLRSDQVPEQFRIFISFSEKLRFNVVSGKIENQTLSGLTFEFCQFKLCSLQITFLPTFEPIHRASVFFLFNLRPDILLKPSKTLRASERDFLNRQV